METLIVYDTTGFVLYSMSGAVREPVGVPFLWVEIPSGKYIDSVKVDGEDPSVVFKDIDKSPEQIFLDQLAARQEASDAAIAELAAMLMPPLPPALEAPEGA